MCMSVSHTHVGDVLELEKGIRSLGVTDDYKLPNVGIRN